MGLNPLLQNHLINFGFAGVHSDAGIVIALPRVQTYSVRSASRNRTPARERAMNNRHLIITACLSAILSSGLTACAPAKNGEAIAGHSQTEASNLAMVKQIYADFSSGNIDGFIAALDPDMVWNEAENNLYAPDSPYIGIEAIMGELFAPLATEWEFFSVEPGSYLSDGDQVAMFGRYHAKYNASGKTMNPQIVHHWTFKDGKVVAFQQHMDTLAQQQAMTP